MVKRRPAPSEREEAFANGADLESVTMQQAPDVPEAAVVRRMIVRFPSDDLPLQIARLAQREGRSKHNLLLRALTRGLRDLEHDQSS